MIINSPLVKTTSIISTQKITSHNNNSTKIRIYKIQWEEKLYSILNTQIICPHRKKSTKIKSTLSLAVFSFFCKKIILCIFSLWTFFRLDSFFVDFLSWSDFCFFCRVFLLLINSLWNFSVCIFYMCNYSVWSFYFSPYFKTKVFEIRNA